MAIQFARLQYLKRSEGKSAVAAAAYQSRSVVVDPRTGERYDFTGRGALEASTVFLLPETAAPEFADSQTLWGAAEISEKRRNSQVAKQLLLALPKEPSLEDRMAVARSFVNEHFVSKGVGAQLDFHVPHDGSENYHCHVLITTRRIEGGRFSSHKARDLDARVRHRQVVEGELWGELWRRHQEAYFKDKKLDLLVDPIAPYASHTSYGPKRAWRTEQPARAIALRKTLNAHAARDAALVLAHLERHRHRVDDRTLDKFLIKHITEAAERHAVRDKVFALRRRALDEAARQDLVPSGWRELTLEDLIRRRSPAYCALTESVTKFAQQIRSVERFADARRAEIANADRLRKETWQAIGLIRRALHRSGRPDLDIQKYDSYRRRAEGGLRWAGVRMALLIDKMRAAEEGAGAEFAVHEQAASAELTRRRQIAANARRDLENTQAVVLNRTQGPRARYGVRP